MSKQYNYISVNNTTTLQIPMSKSLRSNAEAKAVDCGFSSLQEVLRVFLTKFSLGEIRFNIEETPSVQLSQKAAKRYNKMLNDLKENKNFTTVNSVEELIRDLHAN